MTDSNLRGASLYQQPVSITRKMAAALPGLRRTAQEKGLKIHHLGAGYPHPEVTNPKTFLHGVETWFEHLAAQEGLNQLEGATPKFLRDSYAYTDTLGPLSPRASFAAVYGADWDVDINPAQLIPTVGATGGIALMCSLFERSGQPTAYITDAPTYAGFVARASLCRSSRIYSVDMDSAGPDPEHFALQIRQARDDGYVVPFYYTVPDGHNPAGLSFTMARRQEILDIARDEHILIVEDAPYLYISYSDERPLPFISLDPKQSVHLFTGSKIGLPGPRVGFLYSEAQVTTMDGSTVPLTDLVLTESSADILFHNPNALLSFESLLRNPDGSMRESLWPIARAKLDVYSENRQIVLTGLETGLGSHRDCFAWTQPSAGFFTVFTLKTSSPRVDDDFISHLVAEYGVVVVPMYDFFPPDARQRNADAGFNQMRLSFCFTESEGEQRRRDLTEAVEAFSNAMLTEVGRR